MRTGSATSPSEDSGTPARPHRRVWPRVLGWLVICAGLLLVIAGVAITVALHNSRVHAWVLSLAEEKASSALNTQVRLQNFALHLSTLSVDLYGVSIRGAEPYPDPPLLLVRHAEAGVRIVSVLHRKWYFDTIRIDDPVARVYVDRNGVSNLPQMKSSGGSHTSIFDLGIRHAVLSHGEVSFNDRKSVLDADLHDVDFDSVFNSLEQKYSGHLQYSSGRIVTAGYSPIPHSLNVQFDATPSSFHIEQAQIASGATQFHLTGTLTNYNQPHVQAQYQASLSGDDLRRILRNSSIPSGMVQTQGSLDYQETPNAPLLNTVVLQGTLKSPRLNVQSASYRTSLADISAQYGLVSGNLSVQDLRARVLGGSLAAAFTMRNLAGKSQSQLTATVRGVSLAELKRMAPGNTTLRSVRVSGSVNADATASWGASLQDLTARANATIRGNIAGAQAGTAAPIPVTGQLHGTYLGGAQQLALRQSFLETSETRLTLNGTVSNRSSLAVQLQSQNLAELESLADVFRTQPAAPLGLGGTAEFHGQVRGTTASPQLTGELNTTNLQFRGTQWRVFRTQVEAGPSLVELKNADLEPEGHGHIGLTASVQLHHWAFTEQSHVAVDLHASQLEVAQLEKLTGKSLPVSGTLTANVTAHGTLLQPAGQGSITLTHAQAYNEPITSAALQFTGAEQQMHGTVALHLPAGAVQGTFTVEPQSKRYTAQLSSQGIQLQQLANVQAHNAQVSGTLEVHASGQGTFADPQMTATLNIPQLEVRQQKMQRVRLQMDVNHHLATANLDSQALDTAIQATAKVQLSGDYMADATLNTHPIALQPLFAAYLPEEADALDGETEIHATLHGPLKDKNLVQAQAVIPMLRVNYGKTIQLAAAQPIHIVYRNGVVDLARTEIRGTGTDLQVQGTVPVDRHGPMSLLLLGNVDMQLAQMMNPDIRSRGQLRFHINSYGAASGPDVQGQVEIVDASFSSGDLPVGVQHANGVLVLTRDRLNIQSFKATMGGGTLTAQGGVAYRPSLQFDLGVSGQGIRLLYPQVVRSETDADLRLTGTSENAVLGGRVRVQSLSFTPDFDLTSFAGQLSGGVAPPPTQGFSQNVQLNLSVTSISDLNPMSRTFSIDGTANLQVRGTAAQPVILGRINLNGGDVIFNGNRFTLAGGTVEFVNPAETQPVINLSLNTTIQQYNIALRFTGPVDQLRTNYSSDPSLPAADIINLLAFGQTTEASAANPTPGDQAAMSAVASQVSSQITSRVAKVAGISQLSINPVLAGGSTQGPAGAVVTIQQRVTGNLFVTFSSNVTSTQSQVIMGQYQISPRVAVSATRDQNGGFGFDTIFKKSW